MEYIDITPIRFNRVSGIERNVILENDFSGDPTIIRALISGGYSIRCGISVRRTLLDPMNIRYFPVCRISINNNPNNPGLAYTNFINVDTINSGTMFANGTFAVPLSAGDTIRLFTAGFGMDSRVVETSSPGNVTAFLEIQRVTPPIP